MSGPRANLSLLIGPETVLALLSAGVFWFCARHNSGEGRDVAILEKAVMLLPLIVVPLVFATVLVPGAKSWIWLTRAIVLTFVMLGVCGGRMIGGFGTGAKGQDAAFILVIMFGIVLVALSTSICGTMILAHNKPGFAEWFRARRILASILTIASSIPIGFALGLVVTLGIGVFAGLYSAIKR